MTFCQPRTLRKQAGIKLATLFQTEAEAEKEFFDNPIALRDVLCWLKFRKDFRWIRKCVLEQRERWLRCVRDPITPLPYIFGTNLGFANEFECEKFLNSKK
jgi:hypothetical protein